MIARPFYLLVRRFSGPLERHRTNCFSGREFGRPHSKAIVDQSDNSTPQETQATAPIADSFSQIKLSRKMRDALQAAEYVEPTPVQGGVIPLALEGKDVLAQARTGTGKTAAFVIPILERIQPAKDFPGVQALILVPTRELAVQVNSEVVKLGQGGKTKCVPIYGGAPIRRQISKLQAGAQMAVGTPGRVIDLIGRGALDLSRLACVVLDEADRMLDIGFRPDIEKILRKCPQARQTLLLSATVPRVVKRIADRYMTDPVHLDFSDKDIAAGTIEQFYFTVHPKRKTELLIRLLEREQPRQAIVFCRTRRGTDRLHKRLAKKFDRTGCIHGEMQQRERDRVMSGFRKGDIRILCATDVVGRGIDVTRISHIINFDIPRDSDDYVHRVGRTGRMGREGVAFSFVTPEEGGELTGVEMRIDRLLQQDEIKGFDPTQPPDPPRSETSGESPEPPPKPLFGRGGRPPKRYRRGL